MATAAIGISALLASSVLAFNILKYLGAAHLIYLGVRKFLEHDELAPPEIVARRRLSRVFIQGIIVNVLAGTVGRYIRGNFNRLHAQRYFAGSVYIGLGLATTVTGADKKC